MILHWLSASWRSLISNPLFSLITIASLSIGFAGALLAGANIKQHMSFERGFAHADQIFMVRLRDGPNPGSNHPAAQGNGPIPEGKFNYRFRPALVPLTEGKLPNAVAVTRVLGTGSPFLDVNGEPTKDLSHNVDETFFDVFQPRFIEGAKETALATPDSVVLTESLAHKLFGDEPAIGKIPPGARNKSVRVSAVISDPPQPSMFDYDALFPIVDGEWSKDVGRGVGGGVFVRMKDGVSRDASIAEIDAAFHQAYMLGLPSMITSMNKMTKEAGMPPVTLSDFYTRASAIPLTDIHLAPREATGVPSTGEASMLWALGAAALALLAVSAFNYVVLSLARALRRRREVGLRKVLGAGNGAVARHYLAEAGLVTAISLALGFGLAELLQPWFARILGQPEMLFNLYDPVFLGAVAATFVILVLIVGAYPALYLANIRPRAGLENADESGGIRRRITGGLLGVQIAAATVLLATALTMVTQARYVSERPLGFNMTNLYSLWAACSQVSNATVATSNLPCTATLARVVRETPGIKRFAWSSNPGIFASGDPTPISVSGRPDAGEGYQMAVDTDFLPLAGAKLIAGRLFDANSGYDRILLDAYPNYPRPKFESVPVVVTRAILPVLGVSTPEEAIGKRFMIGATFWTDDYQVVGVIEDWHQRSLKHAVTPIVFTAGGYMMNVVAEIDEADLADVERRLSPIGGFVIDKGSFRISVTPLSQAFQESYAADRNLMGAVTGFAALAILVACLGVYGLTAFDMRRRVREVGIRKALGAAPGRVAGMMFWTQMRFAAIASFLAWPVAWWVSRAWLESYVYRTSLGPAVLPAASAIILVFVALAVGLNTARAAAIRPSFALRTAT